MGVLTLALMRRRHNSASLLWAARWRAVLPSNMAASTVTLVCINKNQKYYKEHNVKYNMK